MITTIIVKSTENCNSNCVYCSVEGKELGTVKMTDGVLEDFTVRIKEYLQAHPERRVNVVWHGGEPLLMGRNFYEKVVEVQDRVLGPLMWRLSNNMQSNILLYNETFEEVFEKLGINYVGTSYEYVEKLRGLGRNVDSELYNRQFFAAAAKLKKRKIGLGVIYVVTSKAVHKPVETINLLANLSGNIFDMSIRLNPVYREGEAKKSELAYLYVTAEEYGHFTGKAFVHWYNRRHIFPKIQPFQGFIDRFLDPSAALTCDEAGICGQTHLGVDAHGNIYQCGRAMDAGLLKYGNIKDNNFDNVFDNAQKTNLDMRNEILAKGECSQCRFFDYCNGGCPVDSYNYFDEWHKKTYFCETRKIFFEQYFEPVMGIKLERKAK